MRRARCGGRPPDRTHGASRLESPSAAVRRARRVVPYPAGRVHQHREAIVAGPSVEGFPSGVGHFIDLAIERDRRGGIRAVTDQRRHPPAGRRGSRASGPRVAGSVHVALPIVTAPPPPTCSRSNTFMVPTKVRDEKRRRTAVDFLRRGNLMHAAALHDADAVRDDERLLLVVRHVDRRDAAASAAGRGSRRATRRGASRRGSTAARPSAGSSD